MRLFLAATVAVALTACGNSDTTYHPPEYHPPKFEEPKIDPSKLKIDLSKLQEMMTCNKPLRESDLTPEVKAKPLKMNKKVAQAIASGRRTNPGSIFSDYATFRDRRPTLWLA